MHYFVSVVTVPEVLDVFPAQAGAVEDEAREVARFAGARETVTGDRQAK